MDNISQHKDLESDWENQSIAFQVANIGSEVSRALKNQNKPSRFRGAYNRAIELFDLSIKIAQKKSATAAVKELSIAKSEFKDYFNGNSYHTDPNKMILYYDQFATLSNSKRS